jgi:hypothetical protein
MAKAAFNKKRALFTSTLVLKLRKKLVICHILSIALYGAAAQHSIHTQQPETHVATTLQNF